MFVQEVDKRYDKMAYDIEQQKKLSVTFRKRLLAENQAFISKIDEDLRSEAFEV